MYKVVIHRIFAIKMESSLQLVQHLCSNGNLDKIETCLCLDSYIKRKTMWSISGLLILGRHIRPIFIFTSYESITPYTFHGIEKNAFKLKWLPSRPLV